MQKGESIPAVSPSENCCTTSSKSSFALSSHSGHIGHPIYRTHHRSKSLSNMMCPDSFSPGEIRRMKERLLRMNSHLHPSALRNLSTKQKLTLVSLALVDFMSFCSMSIMAPFFPKEAYKKGLSDTLSGLVFSFYALVMFVASPVLGKIIPKFGAKFLFLFGIFVAGACNIIFGFLEYIQNYTLFLTFCLLVRGFEALGASAFSTASYVFVVNAFPNNIGSVLGILETFIGLGMSTGPAVGGILYSVGGFSMPFFVIGIAMVVTIPVNILLLPAAEDHDNVTNKSTSMLKLIKVPAVIVTCMVVMIVSSTWAFLDPTLEPHLRQFNLSPEKVGLVFLLFSALYGISSPAWGWLADKVNNHWSMMVAGLLMCTVGLLLLGPCPFIPYLESSLWLDLVALSILGISVALALIPTFQGVLTSATDAGCIDSIATYSVVAGIWSCMYSLGEVIGPSLGGFLLQYYGFPVTSTVMATMTFLLAIITFMFFILKSTYSRESDNSSDSGISESWRSSNSADNSNETTPLLLSHIDSSHRMYTGQHGQYYEFNQENENVADNENPFNNMRTSVSITGKGSCEV
ncbi:unnamed protein product [Phaedon cochleariae]|uniref:Major facilitator superfamily (MFS) profile domain-containing protein n=1 Tax=Phaedon cochleariae TaxID=80249 RepID=A0A9P0E0C1_PHACE|nr:unnamed protein product [Phaedon cochleariae]